MLWGGAASNSRIWSSVSYFYYIQLMMHIRRTPRCRSTATPHVLILYIHLSIGESWSIVIILQCTRLQNSVAVILLMVPLLVTSNCNCKSKTKPEKKQTIAQQHNYGLSDLTSYRCRPSPSTSSRGLLFVIPFSSGAMSLQYRVRCLALPCLGAEEES